MSLKNYYSNSSNYKVIYNKKYEVKVYRPPTGTVIHNIFTGDFDKTSTYKPFVVVGPLGDESVVSWSELSLNYESVDGNSADTVLKSMKPNGYVKLMFNNINKKYFVALVPYRIMNAKIHGLLFNVPIIPLMGNENICVNYIEALQNLDKQDDFLKNYSGNLKQRQDTNGNIVFDYYVPHGTGDYVVCESLPDGSGPDFKSISCVNGCLFEQYFDMRYISSISINLFSILLEMEMKKKSIEGFKLTSTNGEAGLAQMQYEFVSDDNLANEHNLFFKLLVNNKLGKLYTSLNKTTKDILVCIESLGQRRNLMSYSIYKKKYLEVCKQRNLKEMNDLELLVRYVECIINDACNFVYYAQLQISKETEKLADMVVEETKKMFATFGQGRVRLDNDSEKQGFRVYTVIYQHDIYGIESKSGIKFKLEDSSVEACIFDNNTKRTVTLVNKVRIQNENNIREFINAYRSNLIQVVSGAAFK